MGDERIFWTAPCRSIQLAHSIIRCHGISISNFRIPNSVWGMGGRGGGRDGWDILGLTWSDMACPMGGVGHSMSDNLGQGGAGRKGGVWPTRKRKSP